MAAPGDPTVPEIPVPEVPDPNKDKRNSINAWYQESYGRGANDAEVNRWLGSSNFGTVQNSIRDEAAKAAPAQALPFDRTAFRDEINGASDANAVLKKYGLTASGNGQVTLPTGEIMDVVKGARGGGTTGQWIGVGEMQNGAASYYPQGGGGAAPGGPGAPGAGGAPSPASDPRVDELYNTLMGRSKQSLAIDRNDPTIRAQSDAYSANEERAKRNYLADLAEKSGPLANLRGETRMANEKQGQDTAGFEAELMGRELTTRRNEITQTLQSMQGLLTTEQQLALQKELASMDNAIKQQQMGLQGRGLDLQGQQLSQQNDQFLRNLGFQEADRGSYWDALRSGLLN